MKYDKLKKAIVTMALAVTFIMGLGLGKSAQAQGWRWENRHNRIERLRERQRFERIRRLDHQRTLRYRYLHGNRIVGYHDRWGRFHRYGYWDRFGRFYRY
jgi:hypothetical protein